MSDIQLTFDEIVSAATNLSGAITDMREATTNADRKMEALRQMKSDRLSEDINVWDDLKKNIESQLQKLEEQKQELDHLVKDFKDADRRKTL